MNSEKKKQEISFKTYNAKQSYPTSEPNPEKLRHKIPNVSHLGERD